MTRTLLRLAAIVGGMFCAATGFAQQYGQWSWEGTLAAVQRKYDEKVGPTTTTSVDQRDVRLSLGVRGFVLHPALAAFRVAVDSLVSKYADGVGLDTKRLGYRTDLQILPRSVFPVHVYASRQTYDYAMPSDDPFFGRFVPDVSSTAGANIRIRRGPLAGLLASANRTTISFLGNQPQQTLENEHLDWSRASKSLQQHYRLERQLRDYGPYGYSVDDVTFNADDHVTFSRGRWDTTAFALQRSFDVNGQLSRNTVARIVNRYATNLVRGRIWDFVQTSGYSGTQGGQGLQSHAITARALSDGGRTWHIVPFAGYSIQKSDAFTVHAPQAGAAVNWAGTRHNVDLTMSTGASWLYLQTDGDAGSFDQTQIAWSLAGSAGHGSVTGLRKELLASTSRNEIRSAGETLESDPRFGFLITTAGTENVHEARLTLRRQFGAGLMFMTYSDFTQRESAINIGGVSFRSQNFTQALQMNARTVTMLVNGGNATVRSTTTQRIRFVTGAATWRPFAILSLNALYRADRRQSPFEPPLDGSRLEGGAVIQIGAFYIGPQVFRTRERLRSGEERTNDGFQILVSRQFGGWLPIVSAPKPRGVVQ